MSFFGKLNKKIKKKIIKEYNKKIIIYKNNNIKNNNIKNNNIKNNNKKIIQEIKLSLELFIKLILIFS